MQQQIPQSRMHCTASVGFVSLQQLICIEMDEIEFPKIRQ